PHKPPLGPRAPPPHQHDPPAEPPAAPPPPNAINFANTFRYTLWYGAGIMLLLSFGFLALPRNAKLVHEGLETESATTELSYDPPDPGIGVAGSASVEHAGRIWRQ
ncbi:hypothetical protein ACFWPJ_21625, partial [Nocardia sp. NPDC058497]